MPTESGPKPCCSWQVGTFMSGTGRASSASRLITENAFSQPPSATSFALAGEGWVVVPATLRTSQSSPASSASP